MQRSRLRSRCGRWPRIASASSFSRPSRTSGTGRSRSRSRSSSARCGTSSFRSWRRRPARPSRPGSSSPSTRLAASRTPPRAAPFRTRMLLIACGAVPKPAIDGALTFRGPADTSKIERLLAEIEAGEVRRVAFAVPAGAVWTLPAYELALMTAAWLAERGIAGVEIALVTPEDEPLHLFGRAGERRRPRAARRARDRCPHTRVSGGGSRGRAPPRRRRHRRGRSRRRASAPAGPADRRGPADVRGIHPRRPARTGHRHVRRLRRRRHHDLSRQAGRHRRSAGRGRRRGDRCCGRRRRDAASVPARSARTAADRRGAALSPRRPPAARPRPRRRAQSHSGGRPRRSSAATSLRFSPDSPAPEVSRRRLGIGRCCGGRARCGHGRKPARPSPRGSSRRRHARDGGSDGGRRHVGRPLGRRARGHARRGRREDARARRRLGPRRRRTGG